jgi:dihydrofolate synthase/folylpolyglutamate synthase
MEFFEAEAYLEAHAYRGVHPGLERMQFLTELLDDPQSTAPGIHITGTNGKGSTARAVTALLGAGGLTTGLYTSPHLQSLTERVALDGRPMGEQQFADTLAELVPYFDHMESVRGEGPTYFEICTMLGFAAFANRGVAAQVVEVGLGGRWDATNVFDGDVAIVTNVDIDHTNFLGTDRLSIAGEKAGIIKPGSVAVTGETDDEVIEVIAARCREVGARLLRMGEDFDVEDDSVALGGRYLSVRTSTGTYADLFLPLHGAHQSANAACAVAAVEAFYGNALSVDVVREGLADVRSPGRLEVVRRDPLVVLDVAHNPHGARAMAAALPESFAYDERIVVLGILDDKDRAGMLPCIVDGARVVASAPADSRAVPPDVLAKEAEDAGAISVVVVPGIAGAVDRAVSMAGRGDMVVITGSCYTVGEARIHLMGPGPAF